ncbi:MULTISPECIES: hypothetical protein [Burkholderia]|uniref:hypothetical protein n=1 Tax=Burkholderia TaxID=32008 RepID=UPI0005722BEC|nr:MULTISPECIES: hypothetical protein [Burkholderia]KVG97395.1 hypothetical protein WS82_28600 [Burkholderia sp. MSMB2041]KVK82620.1 hypothetical protein WS91_08680 [Burkholderia sp. MSMB1498]AOJ68843.1 hypothetical protein WS78_08820 [Burkholderia savannae]KVG37782.1 hypothetical protein WS77_21525 [Burkholderia sp. MSMB0265]KVG78104.1 hypothetical protein WS81_16270 [Burkholderia sp. MSMB2040]
MSPPGRLRRAAIAPTLPAPPVAPGRLVRASVTARDSALVDMTRHLALVRPAENVAGAGAKPSAGIAVDRTSGATSLQFRGMKTEDRFARARREPARRPQAPESTASRCPA